MTCRILARSELDLVRALRALGKAGAAGAPWRLYQSGSETILEVEWGTESTSNAPTLDSFQAQHKDAGRSEGKELARIPLLTIRENPSRPLSAIMLIPDEDLLREVVVDCLRMGCGDLALARFTPPGATNVMTGFRVHQPSSFLLNEWCERGMEIFAPSLLNPELWVSWGMDHPLADRIVAKQDILRNGEWGNLQGVQWRSAYDRIEPEFHPQPVTMDREEPRKIRVNVALKPARETPVAEAWIMPADNHPALQEWTSTLDPSAQHSCTVGFLRPADAMSPGRIMLIRKSPKKLRDAPTGAVPLYSLPQHPRVFLMCGYALYPNLRHDMYAKLIPISPGRLGVLLLESGVLLRIELPENIFVPLSSIVEIVMEAERSEIEARIRESVLNLSSYRIDPPSRIVERSGSPRENKKQNSAESAPVMTEGKKPEAPSQTAPPPILSSAPEINEFRGTNGEERDHHLHLELAATQILLMIFRDGATSELWTSLAETFAANELDSRFRCRMEALWCDTTDEAAQNTIAFLDADIGAAGTRTTPGEIPRLAQYCLSAALNPGSLSNPPSVEQGYEKLRKFEGNMDLKTLWMLWLFFLRHNHDRVEIRHLHERITKRLGYEQQWGAGLPGSLLQLIQMVMTRPASLTDGSNVLHTDLGIAKPLIERIPRANFRAACRASLALGYAQSGFWSEAEQLLQRSLDETVNESTVYRTLILCYAEAISRLAPDPALFHLPLQGLLKDMEFHRALTSGVRADILLIQESLKKRIGEAKPARALLSEKYRLFYPSDVYAAVSTSLPDDETMDVKKRVEDAIALIEQYPSMKLKERQKFNLLISLHHCRLMETGEIDAARRIFDRFRNMVDDLGPALYKNSRFYGILILLTVAEMSIDFGMDNVAISYLQLALGPEAYQPPSAIDALDIISKAAAVSESLPPASRREAALERSLDILLNPSSEKWIPTIELQSLLTKLKIVDQVLVAFVSCEKWISGLVDRFERKEEVEMRTRMLSELRAYLGKGEE